MTKMAGGPELSVATAGESVELHCAAETSNPASGFKWLRKGVEVTSLKLSPETGYLFSRSCVVETRFLIPSIEQSKRAVVITLILNIFIIFYGSSKKCKALYSVTCVFVSIVNFIHLLCSMCC
jgi:hypothetical protein